MMDTDTLNQRSVDKTYDRFIARTDHLIKTEGYGATDGGLAITQAFIPRLAEGFGEALERQGNPSDRQLVTVIRGLPKEVLSLSTMQSALQAIGRQSVYLQTLLLIGGTIAGEAWAHQLTQDNPKLAAKIERHVRKRTGSVATRQQAARSLARANGFKQRRWGPVERAAAGQWCLNVLLETLPDVFTVEGPETDRRLTLLSGAEDLAEIAISETLRANPVRLPMVEPPLPWDHFGSGGYTDERQKGPMLRSRHKSTAAAVKAAIRAGTLEPAQRALGALQGVAWTINRPILELVRWAYDAGVEVKGLPRKTDLPPPPHPRAWELMDDAEKRLWKYRAHQNAKRNLSYRGQRVMLAEDLETAELMTEAGRFYTPMNCDWRGRVYGLPHFQFQRDDRVRAMFLFADGAPIGEEGLWWLKVHVANTGAFDGIDKRPLAERVAWAESHSFQIRETAEAPRLMADWWSQADKPFLFVAACQELAAALASGSAYATRLPVSFDGSCSGLQHLCAMTRSSEGSLVNLTSSDTPQDVYATVAALVRSRVEADLGDPEVTAYASMWLAHGITRKVVKRNVMTYAYSSKKFGMSEQINEDLMKPLRFEVLERKLDEHPFTDNEETQRGAARYLAAHVYAAIEEIVSLPAQAMTFLQKLARALAHEGKPLEWTTPVGLPWINRYHEPRMTRMKLWLHDKGVRVQHRTSVADGEQPEIAKDKAANGVAPNFVHALDAAHLMLTVNAAAAEGIQCATVHDSFGCLAPHARRFNQIIREQFVQMYETHDVLQEVLDRAQCGLTQHNWNKLPTKPARGELELSEVLNAQFAFA